jgi:hypothetical protein
VNSKRFRAVRQSFGDYQVIDQVGPNAEPNWLGNKSGQKEIQVRFTYLRIQNFRSCRNITLEIGGMHALVGANNTDESSFFSRAACIFTRFEDNKALAYIKPDLNTLETMNESSEKSHHGNAPHLDADELHGFVPRTLSLAGGC